MTNEPPPIIGDPGPAVPRLLYSVRECCLATGLCAKSLWHLEKRGLLKPIRIGRAVRYDLKDIKAFIARAKEGGQ